MSAKDCLYGIAAARQITALKPQGWADDEDDPQNPNAQSQRVVCFSEAPLEHIYSLAAPIANRQAALEPWGLLITKMVARQVGVNPVWYVDKTAGQHTQWEIGDALTLIKANAIVHPGGFHAHPAAKILPFFEVMGTWRNVQPVSRREWWWEREWRKRGDFNFGFDQIAFWVVPEHEQDAFKAHISAIEAHAKARCIDAKWGLEEIIARLAEQSPTTPFYDM